MSFKIDYPELFQFFTGYFPDADFENLTDEEVVSNYIVDCSKSEASRQELERAKGDLGQLISDIEIFWKEIGFESNRHFESMEDALKWVQMIRQELVKADKN